MRNIYAETKNLRLQFVPVQPRSVHTEKDVEFKIKHISDEAPSWDANRLFDARHQMRPY